MCRGSCSFWCTIFFLFTLQDPSPLFSTLFLFSPSLLTCVDSSVLASAFQLKGTLEGDSREWLSETEVFLLVAACHWSYFELPTSFHQRSELSFRRSSASRFLELFPLLIPSGLGVIEPDSFFHCAVCADHWSNEFSKRKRIYSWGGHMWRWESKSQIPLPEDRVQGYLWD